MVSFSQMSEDVVQAWVHLMCVKYAGNVMMI